MPGEEIKEGQQTSAHSRSLREASHRGELSVSLCTRLKALISCSRAGFCQCRKPNGKSLQMRQRSTWKRDPRGQRKPGPRFLFTFLLVAVTSSLQQLPPFPSTLQATGSVKLSSIVTGDSGNPRRTFPRTIDELTTVHEDSLCSLSCFFSRVFENSLRVYSA